MQGTSGVLGLSLLPRPLEHILHFQMLAMRQPVQFAEDGACFVGRSAAA